ncbi:MAG: type VI secretion system baseplate subunit TssF [Acidobacteriota bacterium]
MSLRDRQNEADRRYYDAELNYLDQAGSDYARLYPDRAEYLGLRDVASRDPHVERLVQSFAWLSGQIHQRLDNDFPELTHSLMELAWPHYLRPIPSLALLQFNPRPGELDQPQTVDRGFRVKSRRTSLEVRCHFRTVYPVRLFPLTVDDAGIAVGDDGQRRLEIRLRLLPGADGKKIDLDGLRFFLMGEPSVTFRAYDLLRRSVSRLRLRFGRDNERVFRAPSENGVIQPVGFAEGEELLPYPGISFPGYRLLAEYFAFPEKFLFVELRDLGTLELEDGQETFHLTFEFDRRPPDEFRPTTDNFQLHVTPIINLFAKDGKPIAVEHLRQWEHVEGDRLYPGAYEVITVDDVQALRDGEGRSRTRYPFYSFEHDPEAGGDGIFYHVTHRPGLGQNWRTELRLISSSSDAKLPRSETLSLELTCMNGRLCSELGVGEINTADGDLCSYAVFKNITRPTAPVYPDLGERAPWNFISHMALNFLSLGEATALRQILTLYDLGGKRANKRRIDSILVAESQPLQRLIGGAPVCGSELALTVDESHFADEGDLFLFSEVLNEFFALYASTNSFTRLRIRHSKPEKDDLECPLKIGKQPLV